MVQVTRTAHGDHCSPSLPGPSTHSRVPIPDTSVGVHFVKCRPSHAHLLPKNLPRLLRAFKPKLQPLSKTPKAVLMSSPLASSTRGRPLPQAASATGKSPRSLCSSWCSLSQLRAHACVHTLTHTTPIPKFLLRTVFAPALRHGYS